MADRGPNYTVERRRLELQREEHEDTIAKGQSRLGEIERAKKRNIDRAELANLELDSEAEKVKENETALRGKIEEINTNLKAMLRPGGSDG
jgi:hypothetical protein